MSTLDFFGSEICGRKYLGFLPTSNSTKPAHIANGLFRVVSGETCSTRDVHTWILSESKNNALSTEQLIEQYSGILEEGNRENKDRIKQFRFLLNQVFDQDRTVYPAYEFSAYNISSHWLIGRSLQAEAKIGEFTFDILSKLIDGKRSSALALIRKALSTDTDDFTKILKPILVNPESPSSSDRNEVSYPNDEDIQWDECKLLLRQGFDNIADNMHSLGEDNNSLVVLERMVNFCGFATFMYLINAYGAKNKTSKPPILVDSGSGMESIERASEQSFTAAKKAVEDFFIMAIKDILNQNISDDVEACKKWLEEELVFDNVKDREECETAIKSYFESFLKEESSPLVALSHAIQIALYTFRYKNNSPSDFCRVLGVRSGFIGPRGNRANVKRYLFNSFTLETLALSVLSSEDLESGISFKEFGVKLRESYNLILGTDVEEEISILKQYNISQNTPGDLRGDLSVNAQIIAETFISLGHGKKFADGVTIIKWRA